MRKNTTQFFFLFSLFTALIVSGVLVFFIVIIKHKNDHTTAVLTTLENKMLKKKNSSALAQKIAEVSPIRTKLNSYFMNPGEIDSFVGYLESIGTNAGATVKVDSVEVSPAVKNIVIVKLIVGGNFSAVVRATQLLENAPYSLHIQQLSLTKRTQSIPDTTKGKTTFRQVSIWESEILFTILSSS